MRPVLSGICRLCIVPYCSMQRAQCLAMGSCSVEQSDQWHMVDHLWLYTAPCMTSTGLHRCQYGTMHNLQIPLRTGRMLKEPLIFANEPCEISSNLKHQGAEEKMCHAHNPGRNARNRKDQRKLETLLVWTMTPREGQVQLLLPVSCNVLCAWSGMQDATCPAFGEAFDWLYPADKLPSGLENSHIWAHAGAAALFHWRSASG